MKLFEPFKLNQITLKNRLLMPGMDTNFGDEEGNIPDKLIDYYELRARGGVGLIVVEGAYFDKLGAGTATMLSIDSNKRISKFRELVDAIKKHGAHALLQIYHAGAQASSYMIGLQAVAPSAIPFEMSGEMPVPLTTKQISKIVKGYGEACLRAKKAGFDGVEIHAGHGYLLNQFFSRRTNKRDDEYGSQNLENRTRAAVEIIREVRKKCGNDFILGFRLNGSDYIPEGLEIEDVIEISKILEKEGVDLINITGGVFDSPRFPVVPYMNYPKGCFADNSKRIKESLKNTIIAVVGRINTAEAAEEILQNNKADLVATGRAVIADPEFPNKIKANKIGTIRTCIGCNACLNQIMTEQQVLCSINPNLVASDEAIGKTNNPQRILVIGAGPAGMEFARTAKIRGHDILVIEKEASIGGSLNYAKVAPMKKEVQNLLDYYNFIIEDLKIDLKLNTPFTEGVLKQFDPDTVVLATGISPKLPDIEGIKNSEFKHYSEILGGKLPKGQKVVVLGGDMVGIELAEVLSCANKDVTILTDKKRLATDVYSLVAKEIIPTIEEDDKIELIFETTILEIKGNKIVTVQNDRQIEVDFDELALTSVQPSLEIEQLVKENSKRVFKIGDCKEVYPRKILDSVHEGYELGLIVETEEADVLYADELDKKDGDLKSLIKIKIKRRTFTNEDIPSYLDLLAQICNTDAKIQKKNKKANLQYQISIGEETHYFIKVQNGVFSTGEGKLDKPDITIGMDSSIAGGVFAGTVNTASAYMAKELTFEGSMMLGLKFRSITEAVAKEIEDA